MQIHTHNTCPQHLPNVGLNGDVAHVHIFAESIQNTAQWSHVKEGHWRAENGAQHFVMQWTGSFENSFGQR